MPRTSPRGRRATASGSPEATATTRPGHRSRSLMQKRKPAAARSPDGLVERIAVDRPSRTPGSSRKRIHASRDHRSRSSRSRRSSGRRSSPRTGGARRYRRMTRSASSRAFWVKPGTSYGRDRPEVRPRRGIAAVRVRHGDPSCDGMSSLSIFSRSVSHDGVRRDDDGDVQIGDAPAFSSSRTRHEDVVGTPRVRSVTAMTARGRPAAIRRTASRRRQVAERVVPSGRGEAGSRGRREGRRPESPARTRPRPRRTTAGP